MEVDRVRRSTLDIVRKQMPVVREVLDGRREWNNQQVRVFGMLLNKVMPDLHHSFNEHTVENKQVHELTFDELNEIAAQAKTAVEEDENDTNATTSSETPTEDTGS